MARFEITRYLGEGSFGRVYEAHDPLLKRTVALKVAKPEQLTGQRRIERFQREARAAANLLHPHIVAVFDSGQDGPHHYIASAFVPGRSLAAVLEELPEGKTLDLREAVQIVRKLAEALGYAHKQGVIHRDVKPGNVMVRDDGEPMLMDFGLAARLDETERLTVAGQFMGTPEYTAPEQWRGQAEAGQRPVQPGLPALRAADRRAALRGRIQRALPDAAHAAARPFAAQVSARSAARSGDDLPEVPGEGAGAAVSPTARSWPTTCGGGWRASR